MSLLIFLKNILQLILSPANGWKAIEREETPVEQVVTLGLYPLMAVVALTVFVRPLYGLIHFSLIQLLQTAIVQFVALFVAFYIGRNIMSHYLPRYNETGEKDPVAVGNVAAYGTGLMAIIQLLENIIPIHLTVIQLLPAFAAVCIWKAGRYLDVDKQNEAPFMLITVCSLILPVVLINLLMYIIIE